MQHVCTIATHSCEQSTTIGSLKADIYVGRRAIMHQVRANRAATLNPPRTRTIMLAKQHKQEAGRAMHYINQRTLSKGTDYQAVKSCFDQVTATAAAVA